MNHIGWGIPLLVLGLSMAAPQDAKDKPATPSDQFNTLVKDFYEMTHLFTFKAKTDDEKNQAVARVGKLIQAAVEGNAK